MKLARADVYGYKKFYDESRIDLQGKLVALVGLNECGKSSMLEALNHLDSKINFIQIGDNTEFSKNKNIQDDDSIIEATYYLEEDDLKKLSHLQGGKKVIRFSVGKRKNNVEYYILFPKLTRDKKNRDRMAKFLKRITANQKFQKFIENIQVNIDHAGTLEEANDESNYILDLIAETIDILESQIENFSNTEKNKIEELEGEISEFIKVNPQIVYLKQFSKITKELAKSEFSKHPNDEALEILEKNRPKFIFFSAEDRVLPPSHVLTEDIPIALQNLISLANLNIDDLKAAISSSNQGVIATILRNAENNLKREFLEYWQQSKVSVLFSINGNTLYVQVLEEGDINSIAQRSDGLRQFVALLAFVAKEKKNKPILLIDELEIHLHYDAQVDVVQMLTKQNIVTQVIYSTHSLGCLPEDLGNGVRLIRSENNKTSEITNWFWVNKRKGYYPLLFGMGATSLAFIPIKCALFTEGAVDFILLPTMIREAIARDYLGYQIMPGLSEASEEQIAIIKNEAPRIAFLTDSDDGGKKIIEKLENAGVLDDQIFKLPVNENEELVLEDFLKPEIYYNAVKKVLKRYQNIEINFDISELPKVNRPKFIADWQKREKLSKITKRSVAHAVLEDVNGRKIVAIDKIPSFVELNQKIMNSLNKKISS